MAKRDVVELTEDERGQLQALGKKGKVAARKLRRAQLLLLAAEGYSDGEIAAALPVGVSTVERIRKRFVEGGLEWALSERPRPGGTPKLRGKSDSELSEDASRSAMTKEGRYRSKERLCVINGRFSP